MLKVSLKKEVSRSSVLALVAVATFGAAVTIATDASARGFGGGGGFGGHGFGGGGFGGHSSGGGFASRSIAGGTGHNVGGHAIAPSFNRRQSLTPSGLRARNIGHNVIRRQTGAAHASTTASNQPKPAPATPAEPQVPDILPDPHTHLIIPPSGGNHTLPPNSGPQPVKPSPVGPVSPPNSGVQPVKPSPVGPVSPPPHVLPLPPPGHAQPINPPAPVNPTPVNPPSNHGSPDVGSAGPTIAVGVFADDAVIEAPVADVSLPDLTCNRILRNGCYLAMRKFSTSNGAELRCTMICE